MATAAILDFFPTGNSAIRSTVHENPTLEPNMEWNGRLVAEIWPFEIFPMMAAAAILDFFEPEIAQLDPPSPKTPEPNMEWIGRPVTEIWPFEIFEMRGRSSVVGRWSVGRQYILTFIDLIYSSSLR